MISGALFLSREISLRKIFLKYIFRLLIHLILWSLIYTIYNIDLSRNKIKEIFLNFCSGSFHFWYLYTTIELYMMVPFLKEILKKALLKEFLIISFFFTFIIPTLFNLKSSFPEMLSKILGIICEKFNFRYMKGYIFYFIFGYYLNNKNEITNYSKILIYINGLLGFLFTTIGLYNACKIKNKKIIIYFRAFNLNILAYSTSIFVFLKANFKNINNKIKIIIKKISYYTFGIYLIHPIIIRIIMAIFGKYSSSNLLVSIPINSLMVFTLSLIICIIIKKIPFIGFYLI